MDSSLLPGVKNAGDENTGWALGISAAEWNKLRSALLSVGGPASYGELFEHNEVGSAIALTSNAAFYAWATASAGTLKGAPYVTRTGSTLVIGASGAGVYRVSAAFAGTLAAANELKAAIFKNEVEQENLTCDQDVPVLAKYVPGSISGLLSLVAGDIVSLRFGSDANTQTFTMKHCNLTIERIDS